MYERKIPVDLSCPLRLTMSLIDSKWKSCILDELRNVAMRPSELHKALPEATPRVLDLQLKDWWMMVLLLKPFILDFHHVQNTPLQNSGNRYCQFLMP